jgi:5'-nucleotidase
MGNGMWHSGTLAAAYQGSLLGARAIALSTPAISDSPNLDPLPPSIERVLDLLLPRTDLRLVNVNLPARPRGIHWVRQAIEKYDGEVVPARDPYGRPVYWMAVSQLREHAEGTDLWAFERGYITVTPLRLDKTAYSKLPPPGAAVIEFDTPEEDSVLMYDTDDIDEDDDAEDEEISPVSPAG